MRREPINHEACRERSQHDRSVSYPDCALLDFRRRKRRTSTGRTELDAQGYARNNAGCGHLAYMGTTTEDVDPMFWEQCTDSNAPFQRRPEHSFSPFVMSCHSLMSLTTTTWPPRPSSNAELSTQSELPSSRCVGSRAGNDWLQRLRLGRAVRFLSMEFLHIHIRYGKVSWCITYV